LEDRFEIDKMAAEEATQKKHAAAGLVWADHWPKLGRCYLLGHCIGLRLTPYGRETVMLLGVARMVFKKRKRVDISYAYSICRCIYKLFVLLTKQAENKRLIGAYWQQGGWPKPVQNDQEDRQFNHAVPARQTSFILRSSLRF
jgi:hypothetical protein